MNWPIGWTSLDPLRKDYFDDWKFRTQGGTAHVQSTDMRNMWWDYDPSATPYRPQSVEQRPEEYKNPVPNVPHKRTSKSRRLGTRRGENGNMPDMRLGIPSKEKPNVNPMRKSKLPAGIGEIISRVAMDIPDRVNRLEAIGGGQVPAVVEEAWYRLKSV